MSVKSEPHNGPVPAMVQPEPQDSGHKEASIWPIYRKLYTDIRQNPDTPGKRSRGVKHEDSVDSDQESPSKKSKVDTPSKRGKGLGPIPASYEEASEEDKLVIHMREKEGKGWAEIRQVIEDITGVKLGGTTLKNRYTRVKANFVVFEETDIPVLQRQKKEIEAKFEIEKWQKIADGIESTTGNKYPSSVVQKKAKELAKKGNGDLGNLIVQEE